MDDHRPGCPLRGMPWLADAAEAEAGALAERLARSTPADGTGEPDVWAQIRLSAAVRRATPPDGDRRLGWCTCGRT